MRRAQFRFYAELNDFLPRGDRGSVLDRNFDVSASVKDMIESFGVPHTEVDVVLVNGRSVDFSHRVQDGDRISVYPVFESLDVRDVVRVRPEPLREPRFVLDAHLGALARRLRLLGFDCEYRNDFSDTELVDISATERRVLVTRDIGILKRSAVTHGYFVRATQARAQALEVVRRFDLVRAIDPFRRCLTCNELLSPVAKSDVADRLPPRTVRYYDEFRICSACEQVYWKGSHYERMLEFVADVQALGAQSPE
jgi:uncharacterized protein with PIN domain